MKYYEYRSGDKMPLFGLGTWKSEQGEAYKAVLEALKLGYRHIDCAAIYLNEEEIGEAFARAFADGIVKREELWVTSKLWNSHHLPEDVAPAFKKTLSDLKIDYLDLYLIHWPVAFKPEVLSPKSAEDYLSLEEAPLPDTWNALEECVESGLTKHIGVSNFSTKKLEVLLNSRIAPEMNQIELHPLLQQKGMVDFCSTHRIGLTAYSPLGSRDRSAALKKNEEPDLFKNEAIVEIAEAHGCSPAQILIAWAINRGTAVIPKSTNPDRLKQNLEAAEIALSSEEMDKIAQLDQHHRYLDGSFWVTEGNPYTQKSIWDE